MRELQHNGIMNSGNRGPYKSKIQSDGDKSFGLRIRQLRVERNWTQEDLSRAIGADQTLVSKWEGGKIHPSAVALKALADLFQVTIKAMETGKGLRARVSASVEQILNDKISLERITGAEAQYKDLAHHGGFGAMEIRDAMMALVKANQEGRSIWIIVGDGSSEAEKDSILQRNPKGSKPIRGKDVKAPKGHGKRSGSAT